MGICARELFLRTVAPMFVCACLRAVVLSVKHLHWHRGLGTSHPPAVLEIFFSTRTKNNAERIPPAGSPHDRLALHKPGAA